MSSWKDVRNSLETGEPMVVIPESVYPVVGVSFISDYPNNIRQIFSLISSSRTRGEVVFVSLVRNPDNQYDKNAIEVHFDGKMLGHLAREVAAKFAPAIDSGREFVASVYRVRISPENPDNPGLDILVQEV